MYFLKTITFFFFLNNFSEVLQAPETKMTIKLFLSALPEPMGKGVQEDIYLIYSSYAFVLQQDLSWKLQQRNMSLLSFYTCKQNRNKCTLAGYPALFNPKTRPLGSLAEPVSCSQIKCWHQTHQEPDGLISLLDIPPPVIYISHQNMYFPHSQMHASIFK